MSWSSQNSTILAVVLAVGGASTAALAADESRDIEEIVVTGTYIPRDNFNLASPLDVISARELDEEGTAHMGDVLQNLAYNQGTATLENLVVDAVGERAQVADQSFANLRGLSDRATLTLMDGRRTASSNVNLMYPKVAIERIEILKDGGSPLYGTDAVAGVVNFIPYRRYDGAEVVAYGLMDDDHDYEDIQLSAIGGHRWSDTSLVAAVEYRSRTRLRFGERPEFLVSGGVTSSAAGNPGNYVVPSRIAEDVDGSGTVDADEVQFGQPSLVPDPGCGNPANQGSTQIGARGFRRSGFVGGPGGLCRFDFNEYLDYLSPLSKVTSAVFVEHDLHRGARLKGEFVYIYQDRDGRFSPSFPARSDDLGRIAGDHPGNPYRAFVDRNGNGLVDEVPGDPSVNETLFARDDNGNKVPDRDLDGDGVADPGAELNPMGEVLLADNPFDPTAGIPFNEDVLQARMRIFGKGPRGLPDRLSDDGSNPWGRRSSHLRFSAGIEFDIGTGWTGSAWYTYGNTLAEEDRPDESFSAVVAGITPRFDDEGNVVGGLGADGQSFWNPFSTAQFQCDNRVCGDTPTPASAPEFNSAEVVNEIALDQDDEFETTRHIIDGIVTGPIARLPAGPLKLALGLQWFSTDEVHDLRAAANECDSFLVECLDDLQADQQTGAAFFEFRVPILDGSGWGDMEAQVAGRYTREDFGFDSFDPKVALRYQPYDSIALRASWGTSFITPSLGQLTSPKVFTRASQPIVDTTCLVAGSCSPSQTLGVTFAGNPDLTAEQADVFNAGMTVRILDGDLVIDVDWTRIDMEDRIARASGQNIVDLDALRFQAFLDERDCGSTTCIADARLDWIDPDNKATGRFESEAIVRGSTGDLSFIDASWINGQSANFRAIDARVDYRFDGRQIPWFGGDYGSFAASVTASYVDQFDFRATPISPIEHGAGNRNAGTTLAPPLPRWRVNAKLGWMHRNNTAVLTGRFIHHISDDSVFNFFGLNPDKMPSRTTWDVQYTYRLDGLLMSGRVTRITVGAINLFETLPPAIVGFGGAETLLHDPRGRRVYARITQEL